MNEEELWLDHVRMMRLVKSVIETNCEDIYIIDTYIADLKNRINWDKEAIKAVNDRKGIDMVDDYSVAIKALYIHRDSLLESKVAKSGDGVLIGIFWLMAVICAGVYLLKDKI
jgi:hypothetical protein